MCRKLLRAYSNLPRFNTSGAIHLKTLVHQNHGRGLSHAWHRLAEEGFDRVQRGHDHCLPPPVAGAAALPEPGGHGEARVEKKKMKVKKVVLTFKLRAKVALPRDSLANKVTVPQLGRRLHAVAAALSLLRTAWKRSGSSGYQRVKRKIGCR